MSDPKIMLLTHPIFKDHNCPVCHGNLEKCPTPQTPGNCGHPIAKNH